MESKDNIKASDYLYDIGLGLDPGSDELIIIAMQEYSNSEVESFRSRVIEELERMKEDAEKQADHFQEIRMEVSELTSRAMATTYNQSIEKIKNLK